MCSLFLQEAEAEERHENDLRQQLRRQAAAFGDHLNEVLKVQASELDTKYQNETREKLLLARHEFDLKLRGTLARLNGVIAAVENRAEVARRNTEAQELWLACQSLSAVITGLVDDSPQLYPVQNEVETIRRVAGGNGVVRAILDSLPADVLSRGVYTEESLRRRFKNVRKVCKQVALVGEEGGGLWSYLISYFQSLLVFDTRVVKHPTSVDPEELDTYQLLALATSSLENGDTEQAVRYMNQLRGEPRRVARDWIQEARLFLETRQAAQFLTSFASAHNIGVKQQV